MVETSLETCLLGVNCKLTLDRFWFTVGRRSPLCAYNESTTMHYRNDTLSLRLASFPGQAIQNSRCWGAISHMMTKVSYFTEYHTKLCWSVAEAYKYSLEPMMSLSDGASLEGEEYLYFRVQGMLTMLEFVFRIGERPGCGICYLTNCQDCFGGRGECPLPPSLLHVCPLEAEHSVRQKWQPSPQKKGQRVKGIWEAVLPDRPSKQSLHFKNSSVKSIPLWNTVYLLLSFNY